RAVIIHARRAVAELSDRAVAPARDAAAFEDGAAVRGAHGDRRRLERDERREPSAEATLAGAVSSAAGAAAPASILPGPRCAAAPGGERRDGRERRRPRQSSVRRSVTAMHHAFGLQSEGAQKGIVRPAAAAPSATVTQREQGSHRDGLRASIRGTALAPST